MTVGYRREGCDSWRLIAGKASAQVLSAISGSALRACVRACVRVRASGKLGVLYVTMRNLRVVHRLFAGR